MKQTYKEAKEVTDQCMDQLQHIDGEPVHVDICENVMMTVIAGKNHK